MSARPIEEGKEYEVDAIKDLPIQWCRNLGYGHSGSVAAFKDTLTGTVFALKTIPVRPRKDLVRIRKVFRNESGVLQGLKHRHIIRVFAAYSSAREFGLFLLPVADSGNLCDFLDEYREALDGPQQRIDAMTTILESAFGCLASGLAFIHKKRVRHRDIKPQNILVHQDSVIYTDFGYSREFLQLDSSTTEGQPDYLTRRYSAPEVVQHEPRNSSSDIYSLGCLYMELFAALTQALEIESCTPFADLAHTLRSGDGLGAIPSKYDFIRWMILSMLLHEAGTRPKAFRLIDIIQQQSGFICDSCSIDSTCSTEHHQISVQPHRKDLSGYVATQRDYVEIEEKLRDAKRAYDSLRPPNVLRLEVSIEDALAESEFCDERHPTFDEQWRWTSSEWAWKESLWEDPKSAEFVANHFDLIERVSLLGKELHKLRAQLFCMDVILANDSNDLKNEILNTSMNEAPLSHLQKAASMKSATSSFARNIPSGQKVRDWLLAMLENNAFEKMLYRCVFEQVEVPMSGNETMLELASRYWDWDDSTWTDSASDTSSVMCEPPGLHDEIPQIIITDFKGKNESDEWERTFGMEYWPKANLGRLSIFAGSLPSKGYW